MKTIFADLETAILNEPSLNVAIDLAQVYGNLLWFADVGIYDASALEQALISRCASVYEPLEYDSSAITKGSVVHVVTEPYVTGGHTRLMEKLAGMHEKPVDLLITRTSSKAALDRVSTYFRNVTQVNASEPLKTVAEIIKILESYEKIVLHIHPDDIVTVIACGLVINSSRRIFFVNHADHVFSFGCSVADFYFELSSYGKRLDALKKLKGKKSFLGIPIEIPYAIEDLSYSPSSNEKLQFVTAGSDIKFKPVKGLDLAALLGKILSEYPNCTVKVIGSNLRTAYWWWSLKLKYRNRFSVVSSMPYADYCEAVKTADFFVDSYPIPGGTAFAEQFVGGRRCVGLISPLQGYSPADLLKRESVDDVLASISKYEQPPQIFASINTVNSTINVKERYLSCVENEITCPNLLDSFCEWSGDVSLFRQAESSLAVDISVGTFLTLHKVNRRLAIKLFLSLSIRKQLKLLVKLALAKNLRSRSNMSDIS